MQKTQVKPKREKKKNVETGLLMGQNTNIFSQLSASFLQAKALPSQQEQAFLKNTQIVEYHDQNINRLIALLRKKAEVTKVKAVLELREEIMKMTVEDVEEFIPTFAQLYLEIVLNEPSKQIVQEFVATLMDLLTIHKKTVIREINTLYGPLLISVKLSKLVGLLFTGSEEEQYTKALVLLLKREVRKKFGVMFKIVMECDSKEKIGLTNYQRNCGALMRLIKDFMRIYEKSEKAKEMQEEFVGFVRQICESFSSECVDEYLKNGGKAKAAILEIYSTLIGLASRHSDWEIQWQRYAKVVGSNFLDKDPIVQQTLWKSCNQIWFEALIRMDQVNKQQKGEEVMSLLNIYLPKCDQKLLACLRVGGLQMYRELGHFCSSFPWTTFLPGDSHKLYVNKINFMRKILTSILQEEDENEARIQCYCALATLFVTRVRAIQLQQLQEKKAKQICTLVAKLQKQTVENLQEKYYSDPPVSKNSFTFHVPVCFAKLINTLRVPFDFKFKPQGVFALYQFLAVCPENQATLDALYAHCKQNLQLTLRYLQLFPKRPIELDMSSGNKQTEVTAKIFLLTSEPQQGVWLHEQWDLNKKIIAYDPRITQRDLQLEEDDQSGERLYFKPTNRNFPSKLYDRPQMDVVRFEYFQNQLLNSQSTHIIKYLIPLVNDVLIPRNSIFINRLLKHFTDRVSLLSVGKWLIGKHEVIVIRVLSHLIIDSLVRDKELSGLQDKMVSEFMLGYCEFVRLMFNYKMDVEVDQLLRRIGQLLPNQKYREFIFASCQRSVKLAYCSLLKGTLEGQLEKVRKNRLKKCVDLINKLLWYCLPHSDKQGHVVLFKQFIDEQSNWKEAESRAEPWIVGSALLQGVETGVLAEIAGYVVDHFGKYFQFISLVLNADTLLPLQAHIESRKLYIRIKEHVQKCVLVLSPQNMCNLLKGVLDSLFLHGSVNLSQGIKSLISYLLIQNEQNSSQLLLTLQESCVSYPFQRYVKESHNISRSLIFIAVISAVPLKRLDDIEKLYIELMEKLNLSHDGLEYLQVVAICCVFWNKSIGIEDAMAKDLEVYRGVLVKILQSFQHPTASLSPMSRNFSLYSLFSYINAVVPHAGREILAPHQNAIEQLFWRDIAQGSELHGLAQTMRMRYATRSVLTCKPESLRRLMIDLPRIATAEFMFYKQLLIQIEQDGEEELPHYENIVNLFIEIAEFLIRITGYLSEQRHPEESTILQLIQCPFPALKKSAFILLKAMYELKVVPREPPKIYIDLLSFEVKMTDELTSSICSAISTYLYTWQALLLRRSATERASLNEEQITLSLEEYIQNQGYSDLLIKNCFMILDEKLQYLRNQGDFSLTPAQLIQTDYEIDFLQSTDISQKIFKMAMQTLFLYIINFPIFLRSFMDRNKKYKNICERLLRNVICDAIFKQEVTKIQMHEQQWKAAGNFEIYVTAKSREIYAEYTHDVIRIGLRLVMRGNYPLTPIAIQFGEGLKIEDGSRWGLMLQSQLHSRNNTIINGILLWKANIDKKLSGVEECAICFDIVNPTGQLPKKACKTCRKKFHGNCIMRWFSKSNKSECPLCKSQFL